MSNSSNDLIGQMTEFCRDFENPKMELALLSKAKDLLIEEVIETGDAIDNYLETSSEKKTCEKIIDGFGDVAFVAINGIYKTFRFCGNEHETAYQKTVEVLKRICFANLSKKQEDGTIQYNEAGKVMKPEGWMPPSYKDLM